MNMRHIGVNFFATAFLILAGFSLKMGGPDEICEYKCPNHYEKPWNNEKHEFVSNGCGSGGISVAVEPKLVECCDIHDACYGSKYDIIFKFIFFIQHIKHGKKEQTK